ncbi:MAG: tetratricopeptide repeat protein [Gloeomargarita sp. SKYBB_i_bin120]|nr:tetratricopeptide repeat protein [Gloeomargarita sp. SKYG98]MCS7291643.1 tetratricopeptide repeat protein [Gloeomargarita sp. SKYB120]MDW8177202.1 tetratricopeptide repeat protein [Gloeomargarita sp. SKYBB_i_bin120]
MGLPISLCMIVRDEAQRLPACLTSVRDLVAELIVVDTGSTDDTAAIAQAHGARVYPFAWRDDFAAARNYSLTLAQQPWILVLDADEILLPAAVAGLREAIADPTVLVVNLWRQEMGAPQAPYSLVSRLFRNRPDIRFRGAYHELIDDSIAQIQQREPHWRVATLETVALQHWGYTQDRVPDKQARARRLLTQAVAQQPQDAYLCAKLAAVYLADGDYDAALQLLQQALATQPAEPMVQYEIHFHLGLLHQRQGQMTLAQTHYQAALATACPPRVKLGAYTNLGALYQEQGDFHRARDLFWQAVQSAPDWALGYYNLGLAYRGLQQLPAALQAYQKALELDPDLAAAHQNVGVVWCKLGDLPRAQHHWRRAIALYQQQGSPAGHQLQQQLETLGLWTPCEPDFPC